MIQEAHHTENMHPITLQIKSFSMASYISQTKSQNPQPNFNKERTQDTN